MALKRLKELEDEMKKCFRCSLCKMIPLPVVLNPNFTDGCPASREYHFHGYSGSGKQIMGLSLLDGRIKADQKLAEITNACTACGLCEVACKFIMEAERQQVNIAMREHCVDEGLALPAHKKIIANLQQFGHPEGKPKQSPGAWAKDLKLKFLPGEKAEVLLLAGCLVSEDPAAAETARRLAKLLLKAGVDVGILGDAEPSCGLHAYWTGHREEFSSRAAKAVSQFDGSGVKTIVAVGGACLGAIRSKYPEYASAPKAKVVHATEILRDLIKKGRLTLTKRVEKKVTYHDPCYLGRQSEPPVVWQGEYKVSHGCMTYTDPPKPINMGVNGVFDAPREILRAIPGLEFKEMYRIREYSFCCGGGGGVPQAFPQLAKKTALHRIEEAKAIGAAGLVTACHECRANFGKAQTDQGKSALPVLDLIDLVYEAANIEK